MVNFNIFKIDDYFPDGMFSETMNRNERTRAIGERIERYITEYDAS
jgi:hypothetical protein